VTSSHLRAEPWLAGVDWRVVLSLEGEWDGFSMTEPNGANVSGFNGSRRIWRDGASMETGMDGMFREMVDSALAGVPNDRFDPTYR